MVEFLFKVSFVIGIALLFYKLILQQESFFSTNRLYFIFCMALAFALPYVELPEIVSHQGFFATLLQPEPLQEIHDGNLEMISSEPYAEAANDLNGSETMTHPMQNTEEVAAVPVGRTNIGTFSWGFWLLMLYLFGVSIFLLNLLFQVGNIFFKIFKSTDKLYDGDFVIVNTAETQAPCSFFKYIFIHPDDYDFETYDQIVAHEKIHVRLGHSWDLLIAEIAVIVLWFNPLIWIYKREIEKNIEFQTDDLLLEKEQVSKDRYQLNLLQIATPNNPLTITTNYNQSLLKQRIMMMNAKKSTLNRYWKYTFIAPLFLGTFLLLNEPATSQDISLSAQEPTAMPKPQALPAPQPNANSNISPTARPNTVPLLVVTPRIAIGEQEDMSQGFWYSHQTEKEYCIDFRGNKKDGRWNISSCFDKSL